MRVDLVFPVLPPALDGIGDHTARLAETLAADGCDVRVLTAQPDADVIPGVAVERAFSLEKRSGIRRVLDAVQSDPPDWLFLQFNQFSYGRWGLNPYLPFTVREIRRREPGLRIAWMAHEDFMPVTNWKNAIMTVWQRWQFWMLGRSADLIFFSIAPWVKQYGRWFPQTPVEHLPVGSNIPCTGASRQEARRQLHIDEGTFVAGYFGTLHNSRLLRHLRVATHRLHQRADHFLVLYVGPHGEQLQDALTEVPIKDMGPLPAPQVSQCFAAMDLYLAPILDGVSTRRGSFMTGIQHGVATLATKGPQTDKLLEGEEGRSFVLTDEKDYELFGQRAVELLQDEERRKRIARTGRRFYEANFSWPILASRMRTAMKKSAREREEAFLIPKGE